MRVRLVLLRLLPFAPFGSFRLPDVSVLRPGPSVLLRLLLSWRACVRGNVVEVGGVLPPALGLIGLIFAVVLLVLRPPEFSGPWVVITVIVGEIYARIHGFLALRVLGTFPSGSGCSFIVSVGPLSTLSATFERSHVDKSMFLGPFRRPTVALVVSNVLVWKISSQHKAPFKDVPTAPVCRNCDRGLIPVSENAD